MAKPEVQGARKQMDQVTINSIFREHVKKEKQHAVLNENFDFNPKNLFAVTEKPTKDLKADDEDLTYLKTKLGTLLQIPKEKFIYPMTSAQEIGWDMDTEMQTYKPKYGVNKHQCAETKYADNFITFQARSPFA